MRVIFMRSSTQVIGAASWHERAMARSGDATASHQRHDGDMNTRFASLALATGLFGTAAIAGALPKGTTVRIQGIGIESGWHAGTVALNGEGCTMVKLDKATQHGYTMVSLVGTARLERLQSGAWTEMPIKSLRAQEPKPCLVDGSD
jgi:hypothetical protein